VVLEFEFGLLFLHVGLVEVFDDAIQVATRPYFLHFKHLLSVQLLSFFLGGAGLDLSNDCLEAQLNLLQFLAELLVHEQFELLDQVRLVLDQLRHQLGLNHSGVQVLVARAELGHKLRVQLVDLPHELLHLRRVCCSGHHAVVELTKFYSEFVHAR
jgi:hypothetical protein